MLHLVASYTSQKEKYYEPNKSEIQSTRWHLPRISEEGIHSDCRHWNYFAFGNGICESKFDNNALQFE